MSRNSFSFFAAQVPNPATAIIRGVAYEEFPPEANEGNTDTVRVAGNGSEIANNQDRIFGPLSFSQQRDHSGSRVIAIYPFKPCRIVFQFVQGRFPAIETVLLFHPVLPAFMHAKLQDVPF